MVKLVHLREGWRIFKSSRKLKKYGYHQYAGSAKEICEAIIADCWNGTFLQTSTTNFAQFWTRDFGWCVESLVQSGHTSKVHQTLDYALEIFAKHDYVTTTITPSGKPYDFPTYSVDTLPYLLYAIRVSGYNFGAYKGFLEKEIERFYELVIDKNTGLVRADKHFSSMKDYAKRESSCYDNCMAALLQREANTLGLNNPLKNIDYQELIIKNFWNGDYFYDDLAKQPHVAGDANVIPFWLNITTDKELLKKTLSSMRKVCLDTPFPLRYTTQKRPMIWQEKLVSGYEQNAIWCHIGLMFIDVVAKADKKMAKEYLAGYAKLIETHKNFLEVFDDSGKPFGTRFYQCDQGMLWAANLRRLLDELP